MDENTEPSPQLPTSKTGASSSQGEKDGLARAVAAARQQALDISGAPPSSPGALAQYEQDTQLLAAAMELLAESQVEAKAAAKQLESERSRSTAVLSMLAELRQELKSTRIPVHMQTGAEELPKAGGLGPASASASCTSQERDDRLLAGMDSVASMQPWHASSLAKYPLEARSEGAGQQSTAAQARAVQLERLLEEEMHLRGELQQRVSTVASHLRQSELQRVHMQQQVAELQDLANAAIEEACSTRELLERVTSSQDASSPRIRLGELWVKLMEAEQRTHIVLRASRTPEAASPRVDGEGAAAVRRALEEGRAAGTPGKTASGLPLPQQDGSRLSSLRERLKAIDAQITKTPSESSSLPADSVSVKLLASGSVVLNLETAFETPAATPTMSLVSEPSPASRGQDRSEQFASVISRLRERVLAGAGTSPAAVTPATVIAIPLSTMATAWSAPEADSPGRSASSSKPAPAVDCVVTGEVRRRVLAAEEAFEEDASSGLSWQGSPRSPVVVPRAEGFLAPSIFSVVEAALTVFVLLFFFTLALVQRAVLVPVRRASADFARGTNIAFIFLVVILMAGIAGAW